MLKRMLRPTNRRVRLLVGLLLAGLFCIQCTSSEGFEEEPALMQTIDIAGVHYGKTSTQTVSRIEKLAKGDHIELLEQCLAKYESSYRDYTCTFTKQERIRGRLQPVQEIDVKHLVSPFSVALVYTKNAPIGDRILYVEGQNDNKMRVRPKSGLLRALVGGSVLREPDGPEAMRHTLRSVNLFGFGRGLRSLIDVYKQAKAGGDLKTEFGDYVMLGADPNNNIEGRKCLVLVRYLPAKKDYPAWKTLTYIDVEYLLPVCIEGYDWDKKLQCRYIYSDLKFNVGLTGDDFTPQANGI